MRVRANVIGRSSAKSALDGKTRYYNWLKLPTLWPNRILTMVTEGDEFLPYGTRGADAILVEVDPHSLRNGETGYTADLEVIDVWTEGASEAGP